MVFELIAKIIIFIVELIPFDVPSLPGEILNYLTSFLDFLLNMIGSVKVILPWNYLMILLSLSLIIYFTEKLFLFCKFVLKFVTFVFDKAYDILVTIPSKITDLVKSIFGA